MQKRVELYLPSGNIGYSELKIKNLASTERVEPILAPLLSTEQLICQVGAAGLTRFEKIKYIFEIDPKSRLNVCVMKASKRNDDFLNCGRCWKCIHTIYDIEAIGKLKKIGTTFDLDEYLNNKERLFNSVPQHLKHILADMAKKIPLIEAQGGKIPKILLEYQNDLQKTPNSAPKDVVKRKRWFFK